LWRRKTDKTNKQKQKKEKKRKKRGGVSMATSNLLSTDRKTNLDVRGDARECSDGLLHGGGRGRCRDEKLVLAQTHARWPALNVRQIDIRLLQAHPSPVSLRVCTTMSPSGQHATLKMARACCSEPTSLDLRKIMFVSLALLLLVLVVLLAAAAVAAGYTYNGVLHGCGCCGAYAATDLRVVVCGVHGAITSGV
jgi:hypothetical protein